MDTHPVPVTPSGLTPGERHALYAAIVLGVVLGVVASYLVAPPPWLAQFRDSLRAPASEPYVPPPAGPGSPILIPTTVEAPAPTTTVRAPRITTKGTDDDPSAVPSSRPGRDEGSRPAATTPATPVGAPPVDPSDVPVGPEPSGEPDPSCEGGAGARLRVGPLVVGGGTIEPPDPEPGVGGTPDPEGSGTPGVPPCDP